MPIKNKAKSDTEFVELMRPFLHKCRPAGSGNLIDRLLSLALRGAETQEEIERLRKMVEDAYNAGFTEGMREHTSRRGGIPWCDSKYRTALSSLGTPTEREEKP